MVLDNGFRSAIIAVNEALGVLELCRHRLAFNRPIQVSECGLHVGDSLAANRTAKRALRVF